MKTKRRTAQLGVCLLVFVVACNSIQLPPPLGTQKVIYTPIPTVVEPGLAYGEPCKPPCWRGILPGKTTKQEADWAMEQLRASGWANSVDEGVKGYVIQPLPHTPMGHILIGLEDDVISNIVGQVIFHFSVENMIEEFGEPERLYLGKNIRAATSCEEWKPSDPQTYVWSAEAIYPSKGLAFMILIPQGGVGLMCPQWKVGQFCYYPPLSLQEALTKDYLANLCNVDALKGLTEQDLVKWHDFGSGY